jgi:hypothetical protein
MTWNQNSWPHRCISARLSMRTEWDSSIRWTEIFTRVSLWVEVVESVPVEILPDQTITWKGSSSKDLYHGNSTNHKDPAGVSTGHLIHSQAYWSSVAVALLPINHPFTDIFHYRHCLLCITITCFSMLSELKSTNRDTQLWIISIIV